MSIELSNRTSDLERRMNDIERAVGNLDKDQLMLVFNLMRDEQKKLAERVLKLEQKRG